MRIPDLLSRNVGLAIAGLAVFLHLLFVALLPAESKRNESSDYLDFYRPLAERMLDGRGLQDEEGRVAMRYPPGFSTLLAATVGASRVLPGDEDLWLRFLIAACVAANAFLLVAVARRLTGSLPVAALAGVGWAFYPPQLWLTKQPNSELPFLPLVLLGLLLWLIAVETETSKKRLGLALAAGVILGAATLIRPIGLLLAPVVAMAAIAGFFWKRRTEQRAFPAIALPAIVLIAGQLLAVAPWILFVHAEAGVWIPVSSGGRLSLLDGLTLGVDPEEAAPPLSEAVLALTHEVQAHRAEIRGPSDAAAFLARRALSEPWPVAELVALKAARSWYGTESVRHEKRLMMIQVPALLLALAGLWGLARERPDAAFLILGVTLYFWAMTFLVLSILRYMVPAMALLMVPIAGFVLPWLKKLLPSSEKPATAELG